MDTCHHVMYGWGVLKKSFFFSLKKKKIIQCVGVLPLIINNCIPSEFVRFPALKGIYLIEFDVLMYVL